MGYTVLGLARLGRTTPSCITRLRVVLPTVAHESLPAQLSSRPRGDAGVSAPDVALNAPKVVPAPLETCRQSFVCSSLVRV